MFCELKDHARSHLVRDAGKNRTYTLITAVGSITAPAEGGATQFFLDDVSRFQAW
jgi:hypothetical protein